MRNGMKNMEEGMKKVKAEVKHHPKPQGKEDKFIEKMKVCERVRMCDSVNVTQDTNMSAS